MPNHICHETQGSQIKLNSNKLNATEGRIFPSFVLTLIQFPLQVYEKERKTNKHKNIKQAVQKVAKSRKTNKELEKQGIKKLKHKAKQTVAKWGQDKTTKC